MGSALAGLHILEGHIIDWLVPGTGMADVAENFRASRANINFTGGDPERLHQVAGIGQSLLAGREARHRVSKDVLPGQPHPIHRLGCNDERLGGIQAARNPNDDALGSGAGETLEQTVDLDVVSFVAALVPLARITRNIGKARDLPLQRNFVAWHAKLKWDGADGLDPLAMVG